MNLKYIPVVSVLAAGEERPIQVLGDYLFLDTGSPLIQVAINDGIYSPFARGTILQGEVGSGWLQTLKLKNTDTQPQAFRVVHGNGAMNIIGLTTINNPTFSLSADDIAAVRGAGETITPVFARLTNASATYANHRSLSVYNSGNASITVAGAALLPGETRVMEVNGRYDRLASITVNATGSAAVVAGTT